MRNRLNSLLTVVSDETRPANSILTRTLGSILLITRLLLLGMLVQGTNSSTSSKYSLQLTFPGPREQTNWERGERALCEIGGAYRGRPRPKQNKNAAHHTSISVIHNTKKQLEITSKRILRKGWYLHGQEYVYVHVKTDFPCSNHCLICENCIRHQA